METYKNDPIRYLEDHDMVTFKTFVIAVMNEDMLRMPGIREFVMPILETNGYHKTDTVIDNEVVYRRDFKNLKLWRDARGLNGYNEICFDKEGGEYGSYIGKLKHLGTEFGEYVTTEYVISKEQHGWELVLNLNDEAHIGAVCRNCNRSVALVIERDSERKAVIKMLRNMADILSMYNDKQSE